MAARSVVRRALASQTVVPSGMMIGASQEGGYPLVTLHVGDTAPDFEAKADGGSVIRLSDYRGKKVVLFFYPKDSTPGCMFEACSFRSAQPQFEAKNAIILGISADSTESHERFKARHALPFRLISDRDHSIARSYGAWRKKSLLGFGFMWIVRSTFVINEEGRIDAIYDNVNVLGHVAQVLESLG